MKPFRNYILTTTVLLLALSFYIPRRYGVSYPREIGPQFDAHIRTTYTDLLNEQQPEILLFGDSMLAPAIDDALVAKEMGKKTLLISMPGTASTIWYLIIKNNIVKAEHKPKYLVVFFRDGMLTVPGYRTTGRYFEQIDEFASPEDTLLIERAYLNQMTPLEKFAEAYIPFYSSRWTIRQSADYYTRYPLGNRLLDCDKPCMDYAMESVFGSGNLDVTFLSDAIGAADDYFYTPERLNFAEQVDQSFLPEVVRLCQENNIQLVLVRMPILRFYDPREKPAQLDGYIQSMSEYLAEHNVPFLDFDDKTIPPDQYSDTLHLNEQGEALFTPRFIEALQAVVR